MTQQETLATPTATDAVDSAESENQVQTRSYTQEEVDAMMARTRSAVEKRYTKKYEDLGDVEELRSIKAQYEHNRQQEQIKRGEFEKTLQELAAKKDAEISKRDSIIRDYRINMPLLSAAAKYNAVAPEQVKALLNSNVRLNDQGDVEITDGKGSVRYNDSGEPLSVDEFMREWLDQNPHFVRPGPTTTNTRSSVDNSLDEIDVSKLDMRNPEHRRVYAKLQKQRQR